MLKEVILKMVNTSLNGNNNSNFIFPEINVQMRSEAIVAKTT